MWVDFGIVMLYLSVCLFLIYFLNLVVSLSFCLLYVTMSVFHLWCTISSNIVAFIVYNCINCSCFCTF